MTSNQRRPGFRLPWASESEGAEAEAATAKVADAAESATRPAAGELTPDTAAPSGDEPKGDEPIGAATADVPEPMRALAAEAPAPLAPPAAKAVPASAGQTESSAGFMRDLVAAMRRVAEETRQSGLSDLRTKAEEQVRTLEAGAERRCEELKAHAETNVAGVGEWARTESERITQEAEQRVVARRAQLDQQLAAETARSEAETTALRDRVADYERELDAYHAQLSDIADPAAFAAAAKRMPSPPRLAGATEALSIRGEPSAPSTNGTASLPSVHPAEEEVLASRLAELDATLEPSAADAAGSAPTGATAPSAVSAEPTSTEILVKGLGSFGAITGFRQALAAVEGVEGVSLSLGPTGEFVFRAIHQAGFDITAAIVKLEGEAANVEAQPDGALKVTLDRAR